MPGQRSYPHTRVEDVVDVLHGVKVADPYRWLEDGASAEVTAWDEAQRAANRAYLKAIPQREALIARLEELWRYDDEGAPRPCLNSDRLFYTVRKAEQDKACIYVKDSPGEEGRLLLDPNTWNETQTLELWSPSADGRYLAYGQADAGDEATRITILDVDKNEPLDDTLTGWRHGAVAWLHDNSGFYFSGKPLEGTVPDGEHHYWHRVFFHQLGTHASADRLVFADDDVKERYHACQVSQDGGWLLLYKVAFDKQQLYLKDLKTDGAFIPLNDELDAQYNATIVDGQLVVCTDWGAPRRRLMSAPVSDANRQHWQEIVPQREDATLTDVSAIDGRLYLTWLKNAATEITVHDLSGAQLTTVELPSLGTARVWGTWTHPEVWVSFHSFGSPPSTYTWDAKTHALKLYRRLPLRLDTSELEVEQAWYTSADGTRVSMFIAHRKGVELNSDNPLILNGYGGFNVPKVPIFSTAFALWIKAGGVLAVVNLRGGGEYGQAWHEAGMREHKQNVFDDVIAAAEYLIAKGWTSAQRLGILGGSNGGLLVGAAVVQRPDLFKAGVCQVPLLDMIRYHRFGLANIWAQEYGSADDPEMFPHLLAYSPYHNVKDGVAYPSLWISGSVNDARTDPLHARKFGARIQAANNGGGPCLIEIQHSSGHHGAVTVAERAEQTANYMAFLMAELGVDEVA